MKKGTIILMFCVLAMSSYGQQVPLSSQYMMNRLVMNPAYAGELGYYSASLSYRKQWTGIEGAPTTQNLSIHGPMMKGKLGVGIMLFRDVIGVSKENNVSASFAYKIRSKSGSILSLGLAGSAVFTSNQWSQIKTTDANDIAFAANSPMYVFPDFSAGIYFNTKDYFAGFSIPMFLQHQLEGSSSSYSIQNDFNQYNYLLEGGYKMNFDNIQIRPSLLWRYLPNAAHQFDFNLVADIDDMIGIGISYRTQDAIVGMLQFQVNDQIIVGYSYDHTTSDLQQFDNGSHEIFLRYDFRYKVKAIDPRFF